MTRLIFNDRSRHFYFRGLYERKIELADSNITKRAIAASLKSLMNEKPFSKIGVGDICEKCGMNRKSFYYHFRDKYDLINWIFDVEFALPAQDAEYSSKWEAFLTLCTYFYQNRCFYRQAFKIEGQNSFSEHFNEYCCPAFAERLQGSYSDLEAAEFHSKLLTGTLHNAIEQWLCDKEPMPPEKFVCFLKISVQQTAEKIIGEMREAEKSL